MLTPVNASTSDFRISDPFDAAALWHIFLFCDACGCEHETVSDTGSESITQSLPSYHATGQNAKDAGWYIADLNRPTAEWEILCPRCAAQRGRRLEDRGPGATSSEMVRAFYQALTGRTE